MVSRSPLDRLVAGFRGFQAHYYEQRPERIVDLVQQGQHPKVLMVACSDSRVDPAILLNAEPGDLFIVRNVANLVPPYAPDGNYHGTSAAIEFAIRDLKVEHVVVLGHSRCGGIRALIDAAGTADVAQPAKRDFIGPWVSICDHARGHNSSEEVEREAIKISLQNLMTFPWVEDRVSAGDLTLCGWWFQMETGNLWELNTDTGDFEKRV